MPSTTPPRSISRRRRGWVLLAGIMVGCAGGDSSQAADELPEWSLGEERIRIGTVAGGPQALSSVTDVEIGPAGEIYVLQWQENTIKVFDRDGELLRTIGSEGDGPGEFQRLSQFGWIGDTLWTTDTGSRRITLFDPEGNLHTSVPYPEPISAGELPTSIAVVGPNGSVLMPAGQAATSFLSDDQLVEPLPLILTSRDGSVDRSVALLNRDHMQVMFIDRDGDQIRGIQIFTEPFGDYTFWSGASESGELVLVDRTVAAEGVAPVFHATKLTSRGDTVFRTPIDYTPIPIEPAIVDSMVEARAGDPDQIEAVREALFLPETYPPASAALIASSGDTWIARERAHRVDTVEWIVLSPSGALVAEIRMPKGFRPEKILDGEIWGVETDDLDVPFVVAYELRHSAPGAVE